MEHPIGTHRVYTDQNPTSTIYNGERHYFVVKRLSETEYRYNHPQDSNRWRGCRTEIRVDTRNNMSLWVFKKDCWNQQNFLYLLE